MATYFSQEDGGDTRPGGRAASVVFNLPISSQTILGERADRFRVMRTMTPIFRMACGTAQPSIIVALQDSSSNTGAGRTGLVYNTSGLIAYYCKGTAGSVTQITLATQTSTGAYSSGGFAEKSATYMPGDYRLDLPSSLVDTLGTTTLNISGASNLVPYKAIIEVIRLGMSKGSAFSNFEFLMVDSSDHITGKTGLTVTATRSIDGGAFSSCANSVSEVANGVYKIDLATTDTAGNYITFRFTATGADPRVIPVVTTG